MAERRYRYRITVFDEPRTEWRDTNDEAYDDAIRLGLASYDSVQREYFLAVPVEVQKEQI